MPAIPLGYAEEDGSDKKAAALRLRLKLFELPDDSVRALINLAAHLANQRREAGPETFAGTNSPVDHIPAHRGGFVTQIVSGGTHRARFAPLTGQPVTLRPRCLTQQLAFGTRLGIGEFYLLAGGRQLSHGTAPSQQHDGCQTQ